MDNRLENPRSSDMWGNLNNCIPIALIYLLVFQSPLEKVSGVFKYIDELVAVVSLPVLVVSSVKYGRLRIKHYLGWALIPLSIFVIIGLIGNFAYQYQPWKLVLVDLFTNIKFFLALMTGYVIAPRCAHPSTARSIATHLRIITLFIFALFCDHFFSAV